MVILPVITGVITMTFQLVIKQLMSISIIALVFVIWVWLALKAMKYIPRMTSKLGLGETPGLVVAVMALWPLFALTFELFRMFLPS